MVIIVNGKPRKIYTYGRGAKFTYRQLVELAFDNVPDNVYPTVQYITSMHGRGVVLPDQEIEIVDGMVLDIVSSSNS